MKRVLRPSKDTYITNRVINNSFRATDANVGLAGTLDLFKLAGESQFTTDGPFISGTTQPIELSRILIQFDLSPLAALTSSILDVNHSSFTCKLSMTDVFGGQTVPSNFSLVLYPLAQSFDEGIGRDVISFEDVDVANFLTASISSGAPATWYASGANALGYVGQSSIDVITGSMVLGDLFATQSFNDGTEDLLLDVTKIVSATLTHQIPDCGFRISFSGSQETDGFSRFVKRFATRHSTNTRIRPKIIVGFNDSIQDNHGDFYANISGSIFLNNFQRGSPSNLVSGTSLTPVSGQNCVIVTLLSGTEVSGAFFQKVITGSQHFVGSNPILGVYSASFAISSVESGTIANELINAHSATLTEIWGSIDGTVGYYTGSLVIFSQERYAFDNVVDNVKVTITNMHDSYRSTEKVRFRVFAQDAGFKFRASKLPLQSKSIIFNKMYYRLVDVMSNEIIYDFDVSSDSTRLSTDSDGMYFDLYMNDLDVGRVYRFDFLVDTHGQQQTFENAGGTFRVDP